jgi:glyoxylase I family protein
MNTQSLLRALLAFLVIAHTSVWAEDPPQPKQKVLGIGGLFFRSEDPKSLAKWYETNLGISLVPTTDEKKPWYQEAGPTAFVPFKKTTTYFGKAEQSWMVNFRVADLKAMIAQLRAAGIEVEDPQSYPNGDFARLHDPEGNPIELWEPHQAK